MATRYTEDYYLREKPKPRAKELSTDEVKRIARELARELRKEEPPDKKHPQYESQDGDS